MRSAMRVTRTPGSVAEATGQTRSQKAASTPSSSTSPGPLNPKDFYQGYRERLEHKLRHKNTQIARTERLLPTLPQEQRPAFESMLQQAHNDRENIQAELKEIYRVLDDLKATGN